MCWKWNCYRKHGVQQVASEMRMKWPQRLDLIIWSWKDVFESRDVCHSKRIAFKWNVQKKSAAMRSRCKLFHGKLRVWLAQWDKFDQHGWHNGEKNMMNAIFLSQLCTDYNTSTSIQGSLLRNLAYDVCRPIYYSHTIYDASSLLLLSYLKLMLMLSCSRSRTLLLFHTFHNPYCTGKYWIVSKNVTFHTRKAHWHRFENSRGTSESVPLRSIE